MTDRAFREKVLEVFAWVAEEIETYQSSYGDDPGMSAEDLLGALKASIDRCKRMLILATKGD